jgi:predicted transcriptional regulator
MAARPQTETPTDGELEILKVLWEQGPSTVREVLGELNKTRARAYTSVMTMMNLMVDKHLLQREPQGRAFLYRPASAQRAVLSEIVDDLVGKAFDGSASSLVVALLDKSKLSPDEAERIKEAILEYQASK